MLEIATSEVEACDIEPRTVRALTEAMVVVCDAPDLYTVVSASGSAYTADAREGVCNCPDATWRGVTCKHARRVAVETGAQNVPDTLDRAAMDRFVVAALDARKGGGVATDGGEVLGWEADRETASRATMPAQARTVRNYPASPAIKRARSRTSTASRRLWGVSAKVFPAKCKGKVRAKPML